MTQREFAEKYLKVSPRHWSYVVAGRRNLAYRKAQKAAKLLGTSHDLWIDPMASKRERMDAWEEFQRRSCVSVTPRR